MAKPMHEKLKKLRTSCGMQQLLANNAGTSAAEENNAFPPSLPRLSRLPLPVDGTGLFKGAGADCISLIACTLRSRHSFELGSGASDSKPRWIRRCASRSAMAVLLHRFDCSVVLCSMTATALRYDCT